MNCIRHGTQLFIALRQLGPRRATLLDIAAQADLGVTTVKNVLPLLLNCGAVIRDGKGGRGAFVYCTDQQRAIEMDLYA
jgi:DNA-binding IclR family transcriptional regulator